MIAFVSHRLGGNRDRPVIAGAVPNATQPSPVTSKNHTQNVVQTGGASRIEIEDQEGEKHVDIYTPPQNTFIHLGIPHGDHTHTIVFNTEGNQLVNIGGNRDIEVGGPQTEHVCGAVTENYDSGHSTTVVGKRKLDVTGPQVIHVTANEDRTIDGWWNNTAGVGATITAPTWHNHISGHTLVKSGTAQLNFGPTDLFFGPTTAVWGATNVDIASMSGKIGSINLSIPGGVEITTPSWKIIDPNRNHIASKLDEVIGFKAESIGMAMGATGLKVEATGASTGITGFKRELSGADLSFTGLNLTTSGASLKTSSIHVLG